MHATRRKKTIMYYKTCLYILMIDTIYMLYSLNNVYKYDRKNTLDRNLWKF